MSEHDELKLLLISLQISEASLELYLSCGMLSSGRTIEASTSSNLPFLGPGSVQDLVLRSKTHGSVIPEIYHILD